MTLEPGWMKRQAEEVQKKVDSYPDWMKKLAGIPIKEKPFTVEVSLEEFEVLRSMYGRLHAKQVTKQVLIDGPDDPKRLEGAILYDLEMTTYMYETFANLIDRGLNQK
jgi:hypothetical protein